MKNTGLVRFALLLLATLWMHPTFAVQSINVQTFNPSTSNHFVFLEDGFKNEWPNPGKFYFGANYNYVDQPLVATDVSQTSKAFNIINSIQTLDLFFGFKPSPGFGLFFGIPINYITYPDTATPPFLTGTTSAVGDLKLMAKIRVTSESSLTSIAFIPEFHLPTGSTENFVSDASTYVGARIAIEHPFENFNLVGNIGFASASNAIYNSTSFDQGIDYTKRLNFGLGGFAPLSDTWGINIEFSSMHMIPFDKNLNPNELYGGFRYAPTESLALTAGASLGKIGGPTGNNYRVVAGLRYAIYEDPKPMSMNDANPIVHAPPVTRTQPVVTAPVVATTPTHAILREKRIELLSPITFEHASSELMPASRVVLNDIVSILKNNPRSYKKIVIEGHTNDIGGDAYNLDLSRARAQSVKDYLVSKGISPNVLDAKGFGDHRLKVAVKDEHSREINRRVEFIVLK